MAAAKTVTVRRTPDEEGDLCGAKGAADIFGVEGTRIPRWQKRDRERKEGEKPMLPPPIARLANGPVWLRADLEARAEEWRRELAAA